MRKLLFFGMFFFLTSISSESLATTGCLIGSSLYTTTNGSGSGKTYYESSPSVNANGFCLRNGTSTSSCQIRTWIFFFWSYGNNGIMGDFGPSNPPAYCPIDNQVWLLLLGISGFGVWFLRRKEQILSGV